jgi:hypothetical protein
LRQGIDQEAGIARRADAGNRGVAQTRNKIQIDQSAEHHHDHARENLRSHGRDMAYDGALGEVFHSGLSGCVHAHAGSVG